MRKGQSNDRHGAAMLVAATPIASDSGCSYMLSLYSWDMRRRARCCPAIILL